MYNNEFRTKDTCNVVKIYKIYRGFYKRTYLRIYIEHKIINKFISIKSIDILLDSKMEHPLFKKIYYNYVNNPISNDLNLCYIKKNNNFYINIDEKVLNLLLDSDNLNVNLSIEIIKTLIQ